MSVEPALNCDNGCRHTHLAILDHQISVINNHLRCQCGWQSKESVHGRTMPYLNMIGLDHLTDVGETM